MPHTPAKNIPPFPSKENYGPAGSKDRGHGLGRPASSTPAAPAGEYFGQDLPVEHDRYMATEGGFRPSDRQSNAGERGHDLGRG